ARAELRNSCANPLPRRNGTHRGIRNERRPGGAQHSTRKNRASASARRFLTATRALCVAEARGVWQWAFVLPVRPFRHRITARRAPRFTERVQTTRRKTRPIDARVPPIVGALTRFRRAL